MWKSLSKIAHIIYKTSFQSLLCRNLIIACAYTLGTGLQRDLGQALGLRLGKSAHPLLVVLALGRGATCPLLPLQTHKKRRHSIADTIAVPMQGRPADT